MGAANIRIIKTKTCIHAYIIVAPPNVEIKNKPGSGEIVAEEGSRLELQCAVSLEAYLHSKDYIETLGMFTFEQ